MVETMCKKAKRASYDLAGVSDEKINALLETTADLLIKNTDIILIENTKDIDNAKNNGIGEVMIDRLKLTQERLVDIAKSVKEIAKLPSPVDKTLNEFVLYNGIRAKKKTVPFGVIAIIYESRPNVTIDATIIALKAKNAVVLKGGKEALHSNAAFVNILKKACIKMEISPDVIGFIHSTKRQHAATLLTMRPYVDLLIPRGSATLINWVSENAKVPVIETGAGNCHLFVDQSANVEMALNIIENAKVQRPSVCNAVEKIIVHHAIADTFIPKMVERLKNNVTFRVDLSAKKYFENPSIMTDEERYSEYLDYVLGIVVLQDINDAITWINTYGTHHSDGIITENMDHANTFETIVDSAVVYHNASTRFTDGGEFGFGAEIGIATSKLHARGPMALNEMTTYKYILSGKGQTR